MHKIGQSGGYLDSLLRHELPLIGNILKALAESVLKSLRLTVAASATDVTIHKKIFGSGFTTLTVSNDEYEWYYELVKSLAASGLLINSVSQTNKNEVK